MKSNDIVTLIRKLAKSNYWQTIYSSSKELGFRLFKNDFDFTYIQMLFLRYLNFYYSLYVEIDMGEVKEIVLTDDIYEDAYMFAKNKKTFNVKEQKKDKKDKNINWVFKK